LGRGTERVPVTIIGTMGPVSDAGSEGRANMVRVSCADEPNPIQDYLREPNTGELLRKAQLQLSYRAPGSALGVAALVAQRAKCGIFDIFSDLVR
jgi:hypothetical protein